MGRTDFDGDGRDDILFQHQTSGNVISWLGQANGGFAGNAVAGEDPFAFAGGLQAIGDFNGDGRADTFWLGFGNEAHLSLTYPDGAFYFAWSMGFVARVGAPWIVVGSGDFDGDGRDEVLWRDTSAGRLMSWTITNYAVAARDLNGGAAVPIDWQVVGPGDFNGDGKDDILWRHIGGTVTEWLSQGAGSFFNNHAKTGQLVPTDWQIVGTGDFNGDGRDDIAWRHSSGLVTDWLAEADGSFVNNHANSAAALPTDWRVVLTGDFNGDGRDDLLWRRDDGSITNWLGEADGGFAPNPYASGPFDAAWLVQPNLSGAGLWDY